jgi:hypothetical protein
MKLPSIVNPITVTKGAFGLAGYAVGLVDTAARFSGHLVHSGLHRVGVPSDPRDGTRQTDSPVAAEENGAPMSAVADASVVEVEGAPKGPTIVPVESHAPDEPPIDVVGRALAAEAALGERESPEGAGLAHEPRGSSRDEEHGVAALQRAEAEGIADEVAAALEGDVEPEEHLAESSLDAADAKAVATEMRTMSRAADPHKG